MQSFTHPLGLSWAQHQAIKAQALRDAPRLRAQAIDAAWQALIGHLARDCTSVAARIAQGRTPAEQQPCPR